MPITASTLYRDSINFTRNQLTSILLLSLLIAFIALLFNKTFVPSLAPLGVQTTEEALKLFLSADPVMEKLENVQLLRRVILTHALIELATSMLLIGSVITLVTEVSAGHRVSALRALGTSAPVLPRLFLLFVTYAVISMVGLIIIGLLIIPFSVNLGALVFLFTAIFLAVTLCLSPLIMVVEKNGVFTAMRQSYYLVTRNLQLVISILLIKSLLYLLINYIGIFLHTSLQNSDLSMIASATLNNMLSAWVLIYLFRLYTLSREQVKPVAK